MKANLDDLSSEKLYELTNDGYVLMPKRAVNHYEEAAKLQYKTTKDAFLQVFDKINSVFKSSALLTSKFHLNNLIGNVAKSMTSLGYRTFDISLNKAANDIYNGRNLDKTIANGMTYKEVGEAFKRLEGEKATQMKEFYDKFQLMKGKIDEKSKLSFLNKANPLNTQDFLPYKWSNEAGEQIENTSRYANFIHHLENGLTKEEAMDLTNRTMFDYTDLSNFEAHTLKRLMPFYAYLRKNMAFQLENLANNPLEARMLSMLFKDGQSKQDTKDKLLAPDYMKEYVPLGKGQYLNTSFPAADLGKYTDPKTLISSANPLIKSPLEAILNRSAYNDSKVSQFDDPREKAMYVLKSLLPLYSQGENVVKASKGDTNAQDKIKRQWLLKVADTYDMSQAEKKAFDDYATKLNNQYFRSIIEHPELKDVEKANQKKRADDKAKASNLNNANNATDPLKKLYYLSK